MLQFVNHDQLSSCPAFIAILSKIKLELFIGIDIESTF